MTSRTDIGLSPWRAMLAAVGLFLIPSIAGRAQDSSAPRVTPNSNVFFNAPGLLRKKPRPGPPDVKAPPSVWPRLDPGAVFCRSVDDLRRLASRRAGEPVDGPVDCQLVRTPTAIAILQRDGPGMVQVRTTNPAAGGIGWTDAWLPDKTPR